MPYSSHLYRTPRILSTRSLLFFLVSLACCAMIFGGVIRNKIDLENLTMEHLVADKSLKISEVISRLLYKTQALAALVIQNDGRIERFDKVAANIIDDPAILNILIAPDGVVSDVYPLKGHEPLIGYSLLGEGAGNREAVLARNLGQLVFGGPFTLMQGGQALVGRLPVWLEASPGEKRFWGLVSVTLEYPAVLEAVGLESLEVQGYAYELWRVNPDDGLRQTIARSQAAVDEAAFLERAVRLLNADWHFRISAARQWYHHAENWLLILIGLAVSFLIGLIVQNNIALKRVKRVLEDLVRRDPLTGVLNRRGLFERMQALFDAERPFALCYMDINHFKNINDSHGHSVGDTVLMEFTRRLKLHMTEEMILARMSGDEFVLIFAGMEDAGETGPFWREVEREFAKTVACGKGSSVTISFCKGFSACPRDGKSIDALITLADKRMYSEKRARFAG